MQMYEITIIILLVASLMFLKMHKNKVCMLLMAIVLFVFAGERLGNAVPMYLLMTSGVMSFGEMLGIVIMDVLPILLFIAVLICLYKHKNKASAWLMSILLFVFVAGNWNTWFELIFRIREGMGV